MKTRLLVLLCGMAALSPLAASNSAAGVSVGVSVGTFEGPLSQCGYWVDREPYGRCWYPAYVSSSWRPYCNGYWMWTDDGWYWVSDEPWAWACYHYGRWVYDPYYQWVWVPDTVWGPSWVAWRSGGDYVGWAPLSPECRFGAGGTFVFREDVIRPSAFVFVDVHHFGEPVSPHTVIVNNTTIINKTVNVTKITRVNNVVINNGPNVQVVQKLNQRQFTVAPQRVPRVVREISTPRHPAPEVLQPSAVSTPRESVRKVNADKTPPGVVRPRTPSAGESPVVKEAPTSRGGSEGNPPGRQRIENPPVAQDRSTTVYPAYGNQKGKIPSGGGPYAPEQQYQNFGPRPYPYGKVSSGYSEQPKSAPVEQRGRSNQPSQGGKGNQQERSQRRGDDNKGN